MKKLAFLTLIAALAFGVPTQNASAAELNDGPSLALPTGNASFSYNQPEAMLTVYLKTAGDRERVTVSILNRNQQVVAQKVLIVDGAGDELEMDLKELERGGYYVKVNSDSIEAMDKIFVR